MKNIPLFKVFMSPEAPESVSKVLTSGFIGQGPKVDELEEKLKGHFGVRYLLATNSGTSAEELAWQLLKPPNNGWAGLSSGDEVLCTPLTCLWGGSSVLLPDGSARFIKDLVEEKYCGDVMSFNVVTGHLEPKPVIGWYASPRAGRKWINLRYAESIGEGSPKTRKTKGVWLTAEHRVLTADGSFKEANLLQNGEGIVTQFRELNDRQKGAFIGMLLGDSSLRRGAPTSKTARANLAHVFTSEEYGDLKYRSIFPTYRKKYKNAYKQSKASISWETQTTPSLYCLYKRFYARGSKRIPIDFSAEDLTDIGLACWFMDDGSFNKRDGNAVICTDSFPKGDVLRLIEALNSRFNLEASPQRNRRGNKEFWRIYLNKENTKKLSAVIAVYVPECMRYKLHPQIRDTKPFDAAVWNLGNSLPFKSSVRAVRNSRPRVNRNTETVYCIDVQDNHNFISGGLIVHNCTASNWPVLRAGLKIKWVDIDPETLNMDLNDLARKITHKTRAIQLVHWGGYPNDLDAVARIQSETREILGFKPVVLEDCAHAFGSVYKGKPIGSHGNIATFSLQAIKHVTSIDGGFLIVPHHELWRRGDLVKWYGIDRRSPRVDFRCEADIPEIGTKWHMNDVCAAVGLANLQHAEWIVNKHRTNALFYDKELKNVAGVKLLRRDGGFNSAFWIYSLLVDDRAGFTKWMKECGIAVSQVHERNDKHSCVAEFRAHLPQLDATIGKLTHIPVGWWITEEDRQYIVDCIKKGW